MGRGEGGGCESWECGRGARVMGEEGEGGL